MQGRFIHTIQFVFAALSAVVVIASTETPSYSQEQSNPQPTLTTPDILQNQPVQPPPAQPPVPPSPVQLPPTPLVQSPPAQPPVPPSPVQLPPTPLIKAPPAQPPVGPPTLPTPVRPPVSGQHSSLLSGMKRGDISFNFDDADIYEVIQTVFGDILKKNYMVDPSVKGRITFRTVSAVPKDDVLSLMEILLKMNGAGFIEENGLYKILPVDQIPGTTPKVFVYPLQNSKATHIAQLLQSIFTAGSSTPGSTVPPPPQPSQATTTVTKTGGTAFSLGSGHLVGPNTKVLADEITNSLIVLSTQDDYNFIEETVKKLDTTPRQVMIEVLIAEITLTNEFQFGLEWVMQNATKIHIPGIARPVTAAGPIGQNSNLLSSSSVSLPNGISGFSWALQDASGNVKTLLQSLASEDLLTVLASPHILAADNREARIQIGSQVPIATSQATAVGTSNSILSTIQYKDIGTILKVKPQINESGLVAMEVSQEVSDFSTQNVLGTSQFIFSKREATTNLVAQDGQTIVIGGLIQDNIDKSKSGIPFLNSIPILGYLFGTNDNKRTKTEIIVLLTPHVIKNQDDSNKVSTDYINRLKGDNKTNKDLNIDKYTQQPAESTPQNSK